LERVDAGERRAKADEKGEESVIREPSGAKKVHTSGR